MNIYLGNLSINEMQERTGFDFPKELRDYMDQRKQDSAEDVAHGKWHCFDIPFVLVCGDIQTATEIHNHLKKFGSQFKERLEIAVNKRHKD